DGQAGELRYRGYEIGELAGARSFEAVTHLLWHGELPDRPAEAAFRARLSAARGLPAAGVTRPRSLPRGAPPRAPPRTAAPLDPVRTAVSLDAVLDPDVRASDQAANLRKACRLMTLVPEAVAAWQRLRAGQAPVTDAREDGHAAYFLHLLSGERPSPDLARVL